MSSSDVLVAFESSKSNETKREEKRLKQEELLAMAKSDFERAERLKQEKKDRGETTWLLPHLNEKLGGKKRKKSKKKKKDEVSEDDSDGQKFKKKKKSKKKKSKKKSSSSSDDNSSGGSDEDQWCEKGGEKIVKGPMKGPSKMEKDDWMERVPRGPAEPAGTKSADDEDGDDNNMDSSHPSSGPPASDSDPFTDLIPTTSIKDIKRDRNSKRNADREAQQSANEAAASARELNPYWRTGDGSGLPPEKKVAERAVPMAFDGGASWIQKAYKRCVEQAERDGNTLEEVAAQRYGSLEKLEEMMRSAGGGYGRGGGTEGWRGGGRRPAERRNDERGVIGGRGRNDNDRNRRRNDDDSRTVSNDKEGKRIADADKDGRRNEDEGRDRRQGIREDDREERCKEKREDGQKDEFKSRDWKRDDRSDRSRVSRPEMPRFARPDDDSAIFARPGDRSERDDFPKFSRPGARSERDKVESPKFARPGLKVEERLGKLSSFSPAPSWKKKSKDERRKEEEEERRRKEEEEKIWRERETSSKRKESSGYSESSSSSDEELTKTSSSSAAPPPPKVAPLTKTEMNALGAQILKAELRGDNRLAESLKANLEAGREVAKIVANVGGGGGSYSNIGKGQKQSKPTSLLDANDPSKKDQELVLTHTDREGNVWPVQRPKDDLPGGRKAEKRAKKKNERETHDEDGKRSRYFADDDKYSLKDLLQQEKMTSAQDQLNMFNARSAVRLNSSAIRGEAEGNDGDFAVDDVFVAKSGGKQANASSNTFSLDKSIFQSKKIKAATENCQYCIDNEDKFLKHLMVSVSDKACLLLPATTSLVEGHCYIVPLNHVTAVTSTDEDVFEEMQRYRKCLVNMFEEEDLDCVFMETVLHLGSHPHAVVECVPLERELGDMAPIYFKKAMMESDVEWAINKRIVELSKVPGNSIRRAVPRGMPYFHVDFGANAGFAHVIEDESLFKKNFGLEILGGMMDSDPFLWRKPPKEDFSDQMKKCVEFSNKWRPFDWTEK